MADYFIALAPNGATVKAPYDGDPFLLFDGEDPIDMSDYGSYANGLAISPDGTKCLVRTRNDKVVRVWRNGTKKILGTAFGLNTVGFNEVGHEFFAYTLTHYMANGVITEAPKDAGGQYITSQGWTQIIGPAPQWTAQVSPVTIDDITLARPVTLGGWTLGMETASASRILIVNRNVTPHEWFVVWTPYTNQGPGLTMMLNDEPWAAISLPGVIVHRSQFTAMPAPLPPPVSEEKFPRPMFFCPYDTDSVQYGTSQQFVGNLFFPDRAKNRNRKLPMIAAFDTYDPSMENPTLYYYLHGGGPNHWATAKMQFDFFEDKPEKPVIVYIDSRTNWPITLPAWVPMNRAFLGVQAYPKPTESPESFKSAMKTLFQKVSQYNLPMVMTPCFYTINGSLTLAQIRQHMATYAYLAREFMLVGIMPFSDGRTGQGMATFPVLYDDARKLYNLVPTRPNRYTFWTPSDKADAKRAASDQISYAISGWSPDQQVRLKTLIDLYY